MTELSPAARSVFESFNSKFDWIEDGVPGPQFKALAAALRAAADQFFTDWDGMCCEEHLKSIANELEAQ